MPPRGAEEASFAVGAFGSEAAPPHATIARSTNGSRRLIPAKGVAQFGDRPEVIVCSRSRESSSVLTSAAMVGSFGDGPLVGEAPRPAWVLRMHAAAGRRGVQLLRREPGRVLRWGRRRDERRRRIE